MKRLLTIFLISLTLLTFNNNAYAGFFGDVYSFFGKLVFGNGGNKLKKPTDVLGSGDIVSTVRCMVEYTQLDLTTGLEKNVKHTEEYNIRSLEKGTYTTYLMAQDITDKINIWLNENPNNIITNMTIINCQEMRFFVSVDVWKSEERWGEYKGCKDKHNVELINLLKHPNQWGFNVNKERLIKDYEEGCKDYTQSGKWDFPE
jgi:hypothetical protein